MNKPVCLGQSILEISKIVMCEFFYAYVKRNTGKNSKIMSHGYR